MAIRRKIKFSLMYNRTKRLNKDSMALIQIKAYQNGDNRYFSTNIWIRPEHWDKKNNRVKHTHPNQFVFNSRIHQQLQDIERLHEYSIPIRTIRTFTEFFQEELDSSTIKADSIRPQKTTFNKLCEFRNPVFFEDLNYEFITSFDKFLWKQKLNANTVHRHHKTLGKFIRIAIAKDHLTINADPYKNFRPKSEEPDRVFLTDDELDRIERLTFPEDKSYLNRIQTIFLASCYTGLRFSDITKVKLADLSESSKGLVLNLKAQKTSKFLQLPLYLLFRQPDGTSKAERLFRHYMEIRGKEPDANKQPLFGRITNQYYNRELKELATRAGIKKHLSSHCGRRTFACHMATRVQMPILQKLLQHSSLDMTKIYVELSTQQIENELQKVKW
jgi:site-specific recombinase XerD